MIAQRTTQLQLKFRTMENSSVSIFQLLNQLESVFRSYNQNNSFYNQIKALYDDISQIEINSQIIFQQLIASQQKINQLKSTIYSQIQNQTSETLALNELYIQRPSKIKCSAEVINQQEEIQEILQKISAIKSETTFVNQQLSIQQLNQNSSPCALQTFEKLSLRKLLKIYLKKCKANPKVKIPNLNPLCIRLIVVQQSIILYLQKSISLLNNILLDVEGQVEIPKSIQSDGIAKTVSSLSISIEHFLQKQRKSSVYDVHPTVDEMNNQKKYEPIIRSDFNLYQKNQEISQIRQNTNSRGNKCCMWF